MLGCVQPCGVKLEGVWSGGGRHEVGAGRGTEGGGIGGLLLLLLVLLLGLVVARR